MRCYLIKNLFLLSLAMILWAPPCAQAGGPGNLQLVGEFEGGRIYQPAAGQYKVAKVQGDWLSMGRQYGGLLGAELRAFHTEITQDLMQRGISRAEQLKTATGFQAVYSKKLRLLMDGIAQTSGLKRDEVLVLNCGMMLLTQAVLGDEPPSACSALAVWGDYTPDGGMVVGRYWDIDRKSMQPYMKYLGVVVFKPAGGLAFANIHPVGNLYLETGLNSSGLFIELNNGEQSDPKVYEDREDSSSYLLEVLTKSRTLDQAAGMLMEKPADVSYIIQLADANEAVSVERPTFGARVRRGRNGLLAAYNSFVPPYPLDWRPRLQPPPPPKQDPRYANLLALAGSKTFFGKLDPKGMMELLKIPVEQGGALHAGTVVQVVAQPASLRVWIRGVGHADFELIELAGLLKD
jgi:hypothetical protein